LPDRGPLDGVRVVDLTRALAGPYCTLMLADLGADVIKIEQAGHGDEARQWGPPFLGGESAYFLSVNRNKRSLTLNLKTPEGKAILRDLVRRGDVLVENFTPGTLERLGFPYDELRRLQPKLIYCAITGFGQTGPERDRTAYDQILQGLGGVMSITGEPAGPPTKSGAPVGDIAAGMFGAFAVAAALHHRARTGEGQMIDTSMLDGQLALLTYHAGWFFATGEAPPRTGNQHPIITPYGAYRTRDGYVNICAGNDALFGQLCTALELPSLQADPHYRDNTGRGKHRQDLNAALERATLQLDTAEVVRRVSGAGVPCGEVLDIPGVFAQPQVTALGMVEEVNHPTAGSIRVTTPPYRFTGTPVGVHRPPPTLGQHTDEILAELGHSRANCERLRQAGVI
jgi:crotonobetainyl-CoA:carnitine CoA-transferase CaiB-like acyl-CoA transferase